MDQICRICLTVSENMTCKIGEETMILDQLSRINIPILINESLPSLVCCDCTKTLDQILKYRENILQNQNKLIERLRNDTDLDDFYKSFTKDFSQGIKIEIDVENEETDQSFQYDSKEPINKTKCSKTVLEDKINQKFNDKLIYCEVVEAMSSTKRAKTCQDVKKKVKLKKEKNEDGNNIFNNITTLNIKSKQNQTTRIKEKPNRRKPKAKGNSTEVCKKLKTNISEEKSTKPKLDYSEIELKNEEKPFFKENEIDIKIKDNQCLTCFSYLPSKPDLIKHYSTIHNNVDKENGGTDFAQNNTLTGENKDIVTSDKSKRPYNCKICGRTFTCVYAIVRHARAHGDYSLSCSHGCGYSTVYRGALLDHEKRHENNYRYKCASCGAGFHVKTWHDQHQNKHKNLKPFVCDLCGLAFHMDRYLTSHRSTVHAESLTGVKRFICPHCDLAFYNTHNFRTHLEEHIGKKKFLCALCGKVCSSAEQLKYHHNSHLGLKPFACSICNKRFAKKFNLTVHQRAHAGEKHLCQECGKHFAQRSTLLRHTRKCHPERKVCKNVSESAIKN